MIPDFTESLQHTENHMEWINPAWGAHTHTDSVVQILL